VRIAFPTQPWARAYPPSESIAIWSYEVGKRLAGEHEVVVWEREREAEPGSRRQDGIEIRSFRGRGDDRVAGALGRLQRGLPAFASPLYYPSYHAAVARDSRRLRPDVVHVHNFSQVASLLRRSARAPVVLHMHSEWLNQLPRATVRRRLRHVDLVLGCSDYITGRVVGAFPELADRCRTVYEGVAGEEFAPAREEHEGVRLLAVSRISPEKGTHVLLEAFARVAAERPELELDVLGVEALPPPEMLAELDELPRVRELLPLYERGGYLAELRRRLPADVAPRVHFRGFVPHAEAPRWFRRADALVFPSIWAEPFGMPTAEAQAAGLPVVTTPSGGLPEVVEDGVTGLLVEPGDADGLAAAIERLAAEPELRRRLGEAGRRRAAERFGWNALTTQTLELYRSLR
jgi:glycosyltransferase involved in cell wall biosynthesis